MSNLNRHEIFTITKRSKNTKSKSISFRFIKLKDIILFTPYEKPDKQEVVG